MVRQLGFLIPPFCFFTAPDALALGTPLSAWIFDYIAAILA